VQIDALAPTGTASVTLNDLGVPRFHFQENVAWDRLAVSPALLEAVQSAHAICFGTLAQRTAISRATIQSLIAAAATDALRIFDVNLRGDFYSRDVIEQSLRLANVLKLNKDELATLAELFSIDGPLRSQIKSLAEKFQLKVVALTFGEKGSLIYADGVWSEQVPQPTMVVDTVGAGDSFAAALVLGMLARMPLEDIHSLANDVAGFVCSHPGATPALPEAFRKRCSVFPVAISQTQTGMQASPNTSETHSQS
jgi:fructokinase